MSRPPGRDETDETPRRAAPGYLPWAARRGPSRRPDGGISRARHQGVENQQVKMAALWTMILGRFRDYLHMTATVNHELHSTLGGPDDTGE